MFILLAMFAVSGVLQQSKNYFVFNKITNSMALAGSVKHTLEDFCFAVLQQCRFNDDDLKNVIYKWIEIFDMNVFISTKCLITLWDIKENHRKTMIIYDFTILICMMQ